MLKLNDLVKCFDFNTTDECYIEGRVIAIDEDTKTYTLRTTDVVWLGEHKEFGESLGNDTFTTPMLGYSYSDEKERYNDGELSPYQSRIQLVGAC